MSEQTLIRAVIVEDNPLDLNTVEQFLKEDCPELEVIATSNRLSEAEQILIKEQPDLVFLDIQFDEEGQTAFDLLKKLKDQGKLSFQIVFITAHSRFEYYTKAFEYAALHFITKPVDRSQLREAIERLKPKEELNPQQYNAKLDLLINYVLSTTMQKQEIAIDLINGVSEVVPVADILYLKADGKITRIYLQDGSKLNGTKNLGEYSKILVSDFDFFRIHHSLVVNLDYVSRYHKKTKTITLKDGTELAASRRMFDDFLKYREENRGSYPQIKGDGMKDLLKRLFQ
jgi:two-component system LytT family response regulator